MKSIASEKMRKEKLKRFSKQKRSSPQVHIQESQLQIHKSAIFDEENILSTLSSVKSLGFSEITSLATPYTKSLDMHTKLLEIKARKPSVANFVAETSTPSKVSLHDTRTSSRAFVLKRQQFCKGEYTNAKCGRYTHIHPPLCSIPAESLVCVSGSIESLMEFSGSPELTVYPWSLEKSRKAN